MQSVRLLNLLPRGNVTVCSLRLDSTTKSSSPQSPNSKTQKTVERIKDDKKKSTRTIYNVPEYYEHKTFCFYDLEMQLKRFRLPQPNPS
ncbi:hypothetical protein Smp_027360 [Schistosoma mansoni]|uniref:NADH dehydrogenase [ubiquinone] flavoprotein 3, mitochondrial n=1 Tax=Schistosoma mansoni TaxID=6183 RepID=A0AA82N808_SCHMA|nr:hypothetical protein Smp_027360 [Schistosoma mansoni]|eukprot:XP_018652377.1 hypothetical protein Smp_027360 [Schistosoma mansoni]